MWFLRRMLRISFTATKSNETGLQEADKTKSLMNAKQSFFGHLMRIVKPEHLETTGMIEGKRSKANSAERYWVD